MSEQNPTQKAPPLPEGVKELPVPQAICPHCGRVLPGMNVLTMELPTPQGGMIWMLPSCPFIADSDGNVPGGGEPCGKIIGCHFAGYSKPQIARPGAGGWS
jgi:hypothetical protein